MKELVIILLAIFSQQLNAAVKNLGCYKDNVHNRDMKGTFTDLGSGATIDQCVEFCTYKGYKYAGTQNGEECYCGNRFGSDGRVPQTKCDSACNGDNAERCGGSELNAVYSTNYLGCWRESRTRVMPYITYEMPDANATIQTCVAYCGRNGYKYAGAQFYNQCWCGYSYDKYGQVNSKLCDTPCKGNPDQMCGGGYLNSVYDTGIECTCRHVTYPILDD